MVKLYTTMKSGFKNYVISSRDFFILSTFFGVIFHTFTASLIPLCLNVYSYRNVIKRGRLKNIIRWKDRKLYFKQFATLERNQHIVAVDRNFLRYKREKFFPHTLTVVVRLCTKKNSLF